MIVPDFGEIRLGGRIVAGGGFHADLDGFATDPAAIEAVARCAVDGESVAIVQTVYSWTGVSPIGTGPYATFPGLAPWETLAPDSPTDYSLDIHCGAWVLGYINDQVWTAAEAAGVHDWIPSEWDTDPTNPDGPITIELVLSPDETSITASHNGRSVVYTADGSEFTDEQSCQ